MASLACYQVRPVKHSQGIFAMPADVIKEVVGENVAAAVVQLKCTSCHETSVELSASDAATTETCTQSRPNSPDPLMYTYSIKGDQMP